MKFTDLSSETRDKILELLQTHISKATNLIRTDRCFYPMMMIPDTNQVISLMPKGRYVDIDRAYATAVDKLRNEPFTYALFSYSTRVGSAEGIEKDALKTCIFTSDGIEADFVTPYTLKGFFKKTIELDSTQLFALKENFFS